MEGVKVEGLTAGNHAEVRSLILAGLEEHWGSLDPSLNRDLDNMFESYRGGRTLVVRAASGEVVGTGTVVPVEQQTGEIKRMSVAASVRRQGVGRLIVDRLLEVARGWRCDRVIVETESSWTDAVGLYLACGFAITHTEIGEFGEGTWFNLDL